MEQFCYLKLTNSDKPGMSNLQGCIVIGPDGTKYRLETIPGSQPVASFQVNFSQPVGPQVLQARQSLNLSQRAFASLAGISFVALCRIETGQNEPRKATLKAIIDAVNKR